MLHPVHLYASVPVAADPALVARRLRADPEDLVAAASADALAAMGGQVARWGLEVTQLPVGRARGTDPGELGCVEVSWVGEEGTTGWPSLTGRLLVVPERDAAARLVFVSARSPHVELASGGLDRLHRQRVVHVSIRRFLHDLARHLAEPGTYTSTVGAPGPDRAPLFVHVLQDLAGGPGAVRDLLAADLHGLAARATAAAVARAGHVLEAGRFRAPATPTVRTRLGHPCEPTSAWVGWRSDEKATGWPALDLALLIEVHGDGARLVVLSPRAPGYDLSVNRVDKHQRHLVLQRAGADLGAAIGDELDGAGVRASEQPPQAAMKRKTENTRTSR